MPVEEPVQEGEAPTAGAESVQQEPQVLVKEETSSDPTEGAVSLSVTDAETPVNPPKETVSVPENGVTPAEQSGETVSSVEKSSVQSEGAGVASITDPSAVNIDKLISGEELFAPEGEDDEDMADTKHSKKDKKKKSRDPAIDAITIAMRALPPEEQLATVLSKYAELADNNRQLQSVVKGIQKQVENVQREKEIMEADNAKAILTKTRLESLCRELQRQNKAIKEENVARLREEEERRKEVSAKFNTTLTEISSLMKENSDKNNKLREENQDMAGRLQDLVKQYETRESHVEKILKTKDLQCQLVEAKLTKQHIELNENKEMMLLEKKALLEDIGNYQGKLQTMSENEITLRTQLNSYMEKYEEFQATLDKSNKVFTTFKKEMDEMTKKIKKLEKETKTWKERWEGANKALLDMVTERSENEKKMEVQLRQNSQLQNLCRALQEQVAELRIKHKSTPPPEIKAEILNEVLGTKEVAIGTADEMDSAKEEELTKSAPEVVSNFVALPNEPSTAVEEASPVSNGTASKEVVEEDVALVNGADTVTSDVTTASDKETDAVTSDVTVASVKGTDAVTSDVTAAKSEAAKDVTDYLGVD